MKLFATVSALPETARREIGDVLNARLIDGLDLHSHLKLAHWNVKGPCFATLHELFESIAADLAAKNDTIAERAVALGTLAVGTARQTAALSTLPEYPVETTRDLDHVRALRDRIAHYVKNVQQAKTLADKHGDDQTVDLLTEIRADFEKHGWMLNATLEQ